MLEAGETLLCCGSDSLPRGCDRSLKIFGYFQGLGLPPELVVVVGFLR